MPQRRRHPPRPLLLCCLLAAAPVARTARAQVAEPSAHAEDQFDLMNVLARAGDHDLAAEAWNAYGQVTLIGSAKPRFRAAYTNLNGSTRSLLPGPELSFTATATVYAALALWPGGEAYVVPEAISERPLSGLSGLGSAIQNFELQKNGAAVPTPYLARLYLTHTFMLGGPAQSRPSEPMQLGRAETRDRLTLAVGKFSVLDFVDKNSFAGDLRRQFFNMAFLTHAAYDFAADARGYAYAALAELTLGDWAVRLARLTPPTEPNQLPLDLHFWRVYGDQVEVTRAHAIGGRAGAARLLGFRSREHMGAFADAVAERRARPDHTATACPGFSYGSHNAAAPDLCWVRREQVKMGIGLDLEQQLPGGVGVFLRAMAADGRTEVYSYTSTDRSVSAGALVVGDAWRRPGDSAGIGYAAGFISAAHADYLGEGGVDGFIGDGAIPAAAEQVAEAFYSAQLVGPLWASLDYQLIVHPAYNAARGPVHVLGARLHAEI